MNFTPHQITIGKVLVKWLVSQGHPLDKARMETASLLKRYRLGKIQNLLTSTSCTSLKALKLCLEGKNAFKNDLQSDNI